MLERTDEPRRTRIVGWSYGEDSEEKNGCERKTPTYILRSHLTVILSALPEAAGHSRFSPRRNS